MSKTTLYDLVGDFEKFTDILERADVDEEMKSAIKDALDNLCEDIEEKIDDYGKAIKIRKANITARSEEISRLADLNEADNKAIERMKTIIETAFKVTGKTKLKTAMFNFYIQKNPEAVVLDEGYIENIPHEFLIQQEPKVDKNKLKIALKSDDEKLKERLEGIAHLESTTSLRIR